jgi:hypothetical protein
VILKHEGLASGRSDRGVSGGSLLQCVSVEFDAFLEYGIAHTVVYGCAAVLHALADGLPLQMKRQHGLRDEAVGDILTPSSRETL